MRSSLNTKKVGFFTEANDVVSAYYKDIRDTMTLLPEEEVALFRAYKENGDEKARIKLIEANQKFVVSVAKKYINNTNQSILSDLINEGNIGLMTALENFNMERGFKFITYAVWYIKREIQNFIIDNKLVAQTNLQKTIFHVDKIKEKFRNINGREMDVDELMEELEQQHNVKIIDKSDLYVLSFDSIDTPATPKTEQDEFSPTESEFNNMFYTQNTIIDIIDDEDNKILAKEYLTILLPREREIVELYYGINTFAEYTLDDIADNYGFTTERIRQIIKNAIDIMKIRHKVSRIDEIKQYVTLLSRVEVYLLNLHLMQKFTPQDISERSDFTAESIQQALCGAIEIVYNFYKFRLNENRYEVKVKNLSAE